MSEAPSPSPAPPTPTEEELLADIGRLQLVDVSSGVRPEAREYAENYINDRTQLPEGRGLGRLRGLWRRIWHGNIARDYYLQRQQRRGTQDIVASQNLYQLAEGSQADHNQAAGAIIGRFTSEYAGMLAQGEANTELAATPAGQHLLEQAGQLIDQYRSNPAMDYDALVEERNRIVGEYGAVVHAQDRNRGIMYVDNIVDIAVNARAAFAHGIGTERIDAALRSGHVGEARVGARTEFRRDGVDRTLDWMHRNHLTMFNEAAVGVGVTVLFTAAKFTTKKLTSAALAPLVGGATAGVWAALREKTRTKDERQIHLRQRAEGGQIEDNSPARERLEQTRYESISAEEITGQLDQAIQGLDANDQASLENALRIISAADTYTNISDTQSIDLIEYSAKTSVESQRLQLLLSLSQAKEVLQNALNASPDGLHDSRDVDALVNLAREGLVEFINQDVSQKDRSFRRYQAQRMVKMFAAGAIMGASLGAAVQEVSGAIAGSTQGLFEGSSDDQKRQTFLAALFGRSSSSGTEDVPLRPGYWGRHFFEGPEFMQDGIHKVGVDLPQGYQFFHARPGEQFGWDVIGPDGKSAFEKLDWDKFREIVANDKNQNHLHHLSKENLGIGFDTQGNMDWETRKAFSLMGWDLEQHGLAYTDSRTVTETVNRSIEEYMRLHPAEFIRDHRLLWFDNNTPMYRGADGKWYGADLNELKLWWGGQNGSGIDKNGNYVFNIANMRPEWSFHDSQSVNAQELIQEGKMTIALSMTKDTQNFVQLIPVDKNGNAFIDPRSFAGQTMFEVRDGHAVFTGAYAEAAQIVGRTEDGGVATRMLATHIGENNPGRTITEVIQRVEKYQVNHYLTALTAPEGGPLPIEIPPVLPIYSRRGLEALATPVIEEPYYRSVGYMSSVGGERGAPRRIAPFAPELMTNPDADIDPRVVARRYFDSLRPAYHTTIARLQKDLDKQPKAENPRVIVMIPAAAHQEGKNIYHTLAQYARQKDVARDDFEIVVFVNYPEGTRKDTTVKEVKRFQKEHPEIVVKLIEKKLQKNEAKIGWVRKTVADTVIEDLMKRGIDLKDVLLVSNDADSQWIDRRYIRTLIKKADAQPEVDGFLGFLDWSYDAYKARPETLAATRLMQMFESYLRVKTKGAGSSGANFAFRPNIYMAVGGYSEIDKGEDVSLGRMIRGARSGSNTRRPIAFLGRSSEIVTSSRRALAKLLKDGGAPIMQWSDEFTAYDELRNRDFGLSNFNYDDPDAVSQMVNNTEDLLNQTLEVYKGEFTSDTTPSSYRTGRITSYDSEVLRNLTRFLTVIGIVPEWQPDGSFKILDGSRMVANLRRWQGAH
ncbi:TPA: hypothetical protein DIS56_02940 [Candidatus Saccharibacteria bacterium]|nr:MAG: hypothetical protein A3F05_04170 [Candidatus Saccharibacteria bacterium RIFCSPHIGHO2_12_FULL_47_17]HCM52062.1 hypothetical protein [Candidatus Saccharibacteria bacterium]